MHFTQDRTLAAWHPCLSPQSDFGYNDVNLNVSESVSVCGMGARSRKRQREHFSTCETSKYRYLMVLDNHYY